MKLSALISATFLSAASLPAANIFEYTDLPSFLQQLQPGYYAENFSALTPGDQAVTSLLLSGGSPTFNLTLETRNAANTFAGDGLYLADLGDLDKALGTSTTLSDQLRLTSSGFTAIGGNWFLGDLDDNFVPSSVTLTFSDNTSFVVTSTNFGNAFRGYISDVPLTSVRVSGPGSDFVTIDNVVVGSAVPEPTPGLLTLGAAACLLGRRARAHSAHRALAA